MQLRLGKTGNEKVCWSDIESWINVTQPNIRPEEIFAVMEIDSIYCHELTKEWDAQAERESNSK